MKNLKNNTELDIIDCEQGTQEWLDARKSKITASDFKKIIQVNGTLKKEAYKYAYELACHCFCLVQDSNFKSDAMERGNILEPEAREYYERLQLTKVDEVGFMKIGDVGYSPDGLVGNHGLIEIKCLNATSHLKILESQKLPSEHKAQVQGGLAISGRDWCDFISYHPDFDNDLKMAIIRVKRDEEYIKNLLESLDKFIKKKDEIVSSIMKMRGL